MIKFENSMKHIFKALMLSLLILFIMNIGASASIKGLTISYIDVGQADSCLIQADGHNMLIDAGNREDGEKVKDYLSKHGVTKLDYVIGTHPHEDHIGAMAEVLKAFQFDKIMMPKATANTSTFSNLLVTIQKLGKKITLPVPGVSYKLGNAEFTILAPNSGSYEDLNNYSIVIRLVYMKTSFIFQGDAEGVSEKEILDKDYKLKADVIKIGHHGSRSSSTEEYLKKVNPRYAVISCGLNNDYGHPDKQTIDRLQKLNIKLYRTDLDGTVVCSSDGTKLSFRTEKNTGIESSDKNLLHITKSDDNDNVIVYITKSGSKYHTAVCRVLKGKGYAVTLKVAKLRGYLRCNICNPPK